MPPSPSNNRFENLEEVHDVVPTINIIRKAKKKLREIEHLKQKPTHTPEEVAKIAEESYWRLIIPPPKKKLLVNNTYGIVGTVDISCVATENCPICMCNINIEDVVRTNCGHTFCGTCIEQCARCVGSRQPIRCAMCRTNTTAFTFHSEDVMIEVMNALALNNSKYVPVTPNESTAYAIPSVNIERPARRMDENIRTFLVRQRSIGLQGNSVERSSNEFRYILYT